MLDKIHGESMDKIRDAFHSAVSAAHKAYEKTPAGKYGKRMNERSRKMEEAAAQQFRRSQVRSMREIQAQKKKLGLKGYIGPVM